MSDERSEIIDALGTLNYEFEVYLQERADNVKMRIVAKTPEEVVVKMTAPDEFSFALLTNTIFRVGYRLTARVHFSPDYPWTYYLIFSRREWDDLLEVDAP